MKKTRLEDVPIGCIINVGIGKERATVMSKGAMGVRVNVTRNYDPNPDVKDGWTLGPQVWSSGTRVFIVEGN